MKGLKNFPLQEGSKILYIGIASGQSACHFSDIIGESGIIFGVEISERTFRELNPVAEERGNIVPILANAKLPGTYSWVEPVDILFQDAATDDQSEILIRNSDKFLKNGGIALYSLKSRSMDVTKEPKEIYRIEEEKLMKHFTILEKILLDPFELDHAFFVLKKK